MLCCHWLPLPACLPACPQVRVGNYKGEEIHVPFSSLLPMVHPNDFVLGGWDISGEPTAFGLGRWELESTVESKFRGCCVWVCAGQLVHLG